MGVRSRLFRVGVVGLASVVVLATLLIGAVGAPSAVAGPEPSGARAVLGRPVAEGAAGDSIGAITSYGKALRQPHGIAVGSDGNLWVTNAGGFWISQLDAGGQPIATFEGPGVDRPWGIAAGPDGRLWFTNRGNDSIGAITTAGVVANFSAPEIDDPQGIAAGPDGHLWFTNAGSNTIGRVTTAGVVTVFGHASIDHPTAIASGLDGNLWFTNQGTGTAPSSIGRISPAGVVTAFEDGSISEPAGITAGPDGNIWFTNSGAGSIGRITPAGTVASFPGAFAPQGITAGSDGLLWFSQADTRVGSITTDGEITQHEDYTAYSSGTAGEGSGIVRTSSPFPWVVYPQTHGDTIGTPCFCGSDDPYTSRKSGFKDVVDLATDAQGSLHVTDYGDRFPNMGRPSEPGNSAIIRVDRSGASQQIPLGALGPRAVARGPGDRMWFTERWANTVGSISGTGLGPAVDLPAGAAAGDAATGPDGNLWLTSWPGAIGRVGPFGRVTMFSAGAPDVLTAGPDGLIWYAESATGAVGRITTTGFASPFVGPGSPRPIGAKVKKMVAGLDGKMWFTDGDALGTIGPSGEVSMFTDPGFDHPSDVTLGPDGNIWFTNAGPAAAGIDATGSLGRITPDGVVSTFTDVQISNPTLLVAGADGDLWFFNATSNTIGRATVTGRPGPPQHVEAVAADGAATVSWDAPASQGASPVSGFTVTASPGGASCTRVAGPFACAIGGLANGTTYTFAVRATNAEGVGAPSSSTPLTVGPGLSFHPLAPIRVLDSRTATGGWNAALETPPRSLTVAGPGGTAGIPATAGAVVLNVTATDGTANTYLTVTPTGAPPTTASNVNVAAGETVANAVTVAVGTGGQVTFANAAGAVHVVVDVVGYYDAASDARYSALLPARVLDSRTPTGGWNAPLVAGTSRTLAVRGVGWVPADASAVVMNVTATNGSHDSFLTAFPSGQPPPTASNVNFAAGATVPNLVTVALGDDGKVAFANNNGAVDVVADVVGYYSPGGVGVFHPLPPARLLDSRTGTTWSGPLVAGTPRALAIGGAAGIAANATAAVVNVTVTAGTDNSFVTAFPSGAATPNASNVNFAAGQTVPNLAIVKTGPDGTIAVANRHGSVDVVADLAGYFAPA